MRRWSIAQAVCAVFPDVTSFLMYMEFADWIDIRRNHQREQKQRPSGHGD